MRFSIQVNLTGNSWDDNAPVLHTAKTLEEAIAIGYAISHQNGNKTVRLVSFRDEFPVNEINAALIGRMSGTYLQSTETFLLNLTPEGTLMSF